MASLRSRPNPVTPSIPENTAVPSDWRISAPAPVAASQARRVIEDPPDDDDLVGLGRVADLPHAATDRRLIHAGKHRGIIVKEKIKASLY
jgi:hypothetical protein